MTRWAVVLLGVGLGGFVDGIVLHQILQWHHMLSHVEGDFGINTLADGLFHAVAWICVAVATGLLIGQWQRGRLAPEWSAYTGLLLIGWGAFNLVEGIVDHHVLQVHHVRDDLGGPLVWDLGFLAVAALQVMLGWGLVRGTRQHH